MKQWGNLISSFHTQDKSTLIQYDHDMLVFITFIPVCMKPDTLILRAAWVGNTTFNRVQWYTVQGVHYSLLLAVTLYPTQKGLYSPWIN